jgi:two-component system, OmpR family, alkaline phosphatase synthesis response regulator PhoP
MSSTGKWHFNLILYELLKLTPINGFAMKHILMIEEDGKIAVLAGAELKAIECDMQHAATGAEGLALALKNTYDLIITDLLLPDTNGVALSRQLRQNQVNTPLMMLTVKLDEESKIEGLEGSADDYLAKPFSMSEFLSRVKAILRSAELQQDKGVVQDVIVRGTLVLDTNKRTVMSGDKELELSFKEFDLLQLLMTSPGKTYTREQLLHVIWGYAFSGFEHTVETHISRLRATLEQDPSHPEYILTTWGIGYRFTDTF